ncbi:LysM peptidoglycan-binding domain-containing protein [Brevibacillus massiliensis]|uniref:LysM peptidoglycan-binding domain-containing protein n=1 Tax=Brevibacillus massiliensis TaxID=1118054 RepID=UPI0002D374D8|nr:LysM domain-containing protein [Brevibacillus massiliensis]
MRVTLGGFELRDFEKPGVATIGGETFFAIRKFPGGNRSIQFMGADYRPIAWSGFFIGQDAYQRMLKIGNMRTAGKPVQFTTDLLSFPVVIKEFYPDIKSERRIPFTITLERVLESSSSGKGPVDPVDRAAQAIAKSNSATPQAAKTYIVQTGDTLPKIAARTKGDPNKWEEILKDPRNRTALGNNPQTPPVGAVLYV